MFVLNFLMASALTDGITFKNYTAMISFDEGPTRNTNSLLKIASVYRIPIVFHLDPTNKCFSDEIVKRIVCMGFEVGLAVTAKLDEDEDNIREVLTTFSKAFISKTHSKPVLLRLPTIGILSEKAYEIAEEMGYVVTTPNLDSEDDKKTNIEPFIFPAIQRLCGAPTSIVFRDRYERSVNLLPSIYGAIAKRGYQVVPASTYLGISTKLIPVIQNTDDNPFSLSMSTDPTTNTIEVVASRDDFKKQTLFPLNTENKLRARDFVKKKIFKEDELNFGFGELEKLKEEKKVRKANQNGVVGDFSLRVFLMYLLVQPVFY